MRLPDEQADGIVEAERRRPTRPAPPVPPTRGPLAPGRAPGLVRLHRGIVGAVAVVLGKEWIPAVHDVDRSRSSLVQVLLVTRRPFQIPLPPRPGDHPTLLRRGAGGGEGAVVKTVRTVAALTAVALVLPEGPQLAGVRPRAQPVVLDPSARLRRPAPGAVGRREVDAVEARAVVVAGIDLYEVLDVPPLVVAAFGLVGRALTVGEAVAHGDRVARGPLVPGLTLLAFGRDRDDAALSTAAAIVVHQAAPARVLGVVPVQELGVRGAHRHREPDGAPPGGVGAPGLEGAGAAGLEGAMERGLKGAGAGAAAAPSLPLRPAVWNVPVTFRRVLATDLLPFRR